MAPAATTEPLASRHCCICCDEIRDKHAIKPCRDCSTDYCQECLNDMFIGATTDSTRMPPRCCTFLQIHVALPGLTDEEARVYRAKFEEWLATSKLYCPNPRCSAFISPRFLPDASAATADTPTLKGLLDEILQRLSKAASARFFRGEISITELPGYTTIVPNPMDLSIIAERLSQYTSFNDMTKDMTLIRNNARQYHGEQHPISKTAEELFTICIGELSATTDRLLSMVGKPKAQDLLLCPTCHVGICTKCRQVEHGNLPCDTSAADHELAMLETFRYKRCPLCKHAVRKMYGCSHMMCVCGAHWCYWCQKPINMCDGGCDQREDSQDEEDEDEEIDEDESLKEGEIPEPTIAYTNDAVPNSETGPSAAATTPAPVSVVVRRPPPPGASVNLDAGGDRVWAEEDMDFGEEPDEDGLSTQIWSCHHVYKPYKVVVDGHDHGDISKMECNFCFDGVTVAIPESSSPRAWLSPFGKKLKSQSQALKDAAKRPVQDKTAYECSYCRLAVCNDCRAKHEKKVEQK